MGEASLARARRRFGFGRRDVARDLRHEPEVLLCQQLAVLLQIVARELVVERYVFAKLGFEVVPKTILSQKVWQDCAFCPKQDCCDETAMILYTSGTTGQPKGVMMSHRNMVTACDSVVQYLENTETDVLLGVVALGASIVMSTPGKLNAAGHEMHRELADVWLAVDRDPDTRVAIIRGEGKAFSSFPINVCFDRGAAAKASPRTSVCRLPSAFAAGPTSPPCTMTPRKPNALSR